MHINTPRYAWLPDDAPGYLSLLTPARDEDDTLVFFSPIFTRRLHSLRRRSRGIDINFSIRRRCTSATLMHVSLCTGMTQTSTHSLHMPPPPQSRPPRGEDDSLFHLLHISSSFTQSAE